MGEGRRMGGPANITWGFSVEGGKGEGLLVDNFRAKRFT